MWSSCGSSLLVATIVIARALGWIVGGRCAKVKKTTKHKQKRKKTGGKKAGGSHKRKS